jgi:hypothetical protein
MFVAEQRVLSVSIGAARARLANLVHDGWLAEVVPSSVELRWRSR